MTVNLLIRDVPEGVRDALTERARVRGQSMQAYLYELVSGDARRAANIQLLANVRHVDGGMEGPAAAEVLRDLRAAREAELASDHPSP